MNFWFDLENAPDVLFFEPIVRHLVKMNHNVFVTCRNYSNVPKLATLYGIPGQIVGFYGGKNIIAKYIVGLIRSFLLIKWSIGKKIDLAIGFGSRPLALTCRLIRIPNASIIDYEHVSVSDLIKLCNWIYIPEAVSLDYFIKQGEHRENIKKFPGLKEEVYTNLYIPNNKVLSQLGFEESKISVVIRPPAFSAHYHNHSSVVICKNILQNIATNSRINAILVGRDNDNSYNDFLNYNNVKQLVKPMKGLDLIAESDVVISGGGTMVREAVALGIPSYSIFTGKLGAVDKRLAEEGRLILIRKLKDIDKISFKKRKKKLIQNKRDTSTLDFFVSEFIRLAQLGKLDK